MCDHRFAWVAIGYDVPTGYFPTISRVTSSHGRFQAPLRPADHPSIAKNRDELVDRRGSPWAGRADRRAPRRSQGERPVCNSIIAWSHLAAGDAHRCT
jgi:hypothetical protein